jgi:hypothetical protein
MRVLLVGFVLCAAACGPAQSPHQEGDFDRGAAQKALGTVDISMCRAAAGPSGRGHVKVTFVADGSVSAAVLDKRGPTETPIDFSGTPRGDCILEKFRAVKVPPFIKAPVSVGKAITLE